MIEPVPLIIPINGRIVSGIVFISSKSVWRKGDTTAHIASIAEDANIALQVDAVMSGNTSLKPDSA
jgi:hypothetical protein